MLETPTKPGESNTFPATDWVVVLTAGTEDADAAHLATIRICELYWQPIYQFVRRTWPAKSADEAREATQEFFTLRLEKHDIKRLDPEKGLFRNWLQSAAANFLRNRQRTSVRERALVTSLDTSASDEASQVPEASKTVEPRTTLDPWLLLERDLARKILDGAFATLERERGSEFVQQAELLVWRKSAGKYTELEQRWGLSAGTLKVRLYTMRRRLDTLICRELGVPPGDDDARERELAWFFQAIALKEEQPCPKAKALRTQRATPP